MTKPLFQRDNLHYAYGAELKDMQSYTKLKIPPAPNLTKTPLGMTQLHDTLLYKVCISFSP
jgi:hypothetical protein